MDGPLLVIGKLPKEYQVTLLAEMAGAVQSDWVQKFIKAGDMDIVGVDRANQKSRMTSLRQITKSVKRGNSLVIFPEGRINLNDDILYPFYTGSFFCSVNNSVEILPVYIRGAQEIYFRRRINMNFGEPIPVKKGEKIEDVAKRTFIAMQDKVKPESPVNEQKIRVLNLSKSFLGDLAPPPPNLGEMIADGRKARSVFNQVNESSIEKFKLEEETGEAKKKVKQTKSLYKRLILIHMKKE